MNVFFIGCIAGIVANSIGIALDIFLINVVGSLVLAFSAVGLKLSGSAFRKCRILSFAAVPFAIAGFLINILLPEASTEDLTVVALCINVFFYIYITYYFTQALISYAKEKNMLACTRNFHATWTLCGAVVFLYAMLRTMESLSATVIIFARIILLISLLYYSFTMYGCRKNFTRKLG